MPRGRRSPGVARWWAGADEAAAPGRSRLEVVEDRHPAEPAAVVVDLDGRPRALLVAATGLPSASRALAVVGYAPGEARAVLGTGAS